MAKGQEPNYFDEGCKSYWYCEDHHGTLHECPTGFQFDWDKLDCVRDDEVICEKQMEFYYEHVYYHQVIWSLNSVRVVTAVTCCRLSRGRGRKGGGRGCGRRGRVGEGGRGLNYI